MLSLNFILNLYVFSLIAGISKIIYLDIFPGFNFLFYGMIVCLLFFRACLVLTPLFTNNQRKGPK
jgi:hypothetical protein